MGRFRFGVAVTLVLGATSAAAFAAEDGSFGKGSPGPRPASAAPLGFFDVRDGVRRREPALPPAARDARMELRQSLGREGVVEIDPLTGTPRALARLDGSLSPPRAGGPRTVARDYLASRSLALGLDAADVDALTAAGHSTAPDGVTYLRWRQEYQGIPAFDNELRVGVARDGRVVGVMGSPRHDLSVASTTPDLTATDALAALMANVGLRRDVAVERGPSGPRRTTIFVGGDTARLVLFGMGPDSVRLAWHLTYHPTSAVWYDAVVDATSGQVLRRANLVRDLAPPVPVPASAWEQFPGAANGGAAQGVDLAPWLDLSAKGLSGPNARLWSDLDDDNVAGSGEEIAPIAPNAFTAPFSDYTAKNATGACEAFAQCSWDHATSRSWRKNRRQNAVQAFYFVNRFHDHLAAPPIGFTAAAGGFEGDDRLLVQTDDGAGSNNGMPDENHVNNGNMATPPDGQSPVLQLYLFAHDGPDGSFRDINAGDDASTVYHEYTHGMTSRLVTDADGTEALDVVQAGAMGEGWSDWYAMDFLIRQFPAQDTGADGDVNLGAYTDAVANRTRSQPLDCPVESTSPACPGTATAGPGGYTYGDFGHVFGRFEVHADGEIWGETLWDLRSALVAQLGPDAGSDAAERLISGALRLSPPEPSFLDMRNAILQADAADPSRPGRFHDLLWTIFAARGMGFFAGAESGADTSPVEDFSLPPAPGGQSGAIAGRVTSADTGLPLSGVQVGIAGHATDRSFGASFGALTAPDGGYRIESVPAGTYPKLVFVPGGGYDGSARSTVQVGPGGTVTADAALRRDWAATAGGGMVERTSGDEFTSVGCGPAAILDQSLGTGWSASNTSPGVDEETPGDKSVTIRLPVAIDVTAFAMDPGNACGDAASAATRGYKVETSGDGTTFAVAAKGQFAAGDAHRLNIVKPSGGTSGVRFVRLTLLSAQRETPGSSGRQFIDLSEFEVYGGPPNVLPRGPLSVNPSTVRAGEQVRFDASAISDPDSVITGYEWDFDSDGKVDRQTAEPSTTFAYSGAGAMRARVLAHDFAGGSGEAIARVTVNARATPQVKATPPARRRVATAMRVAATGRGGHLVVRLGCRARCTVRARVDVDRATAMRLGLGAHRATVATVRVTLPRTTGRRIVLVLSRRARRGLRHGSRIRARATVTVGPAGRKGGLSTARRSVTIWA